MLVVDFLEYCLYLWNVYVKPGAQYEHAHWEIVTSALAGLPTTNNGLESLNAKLNEKIPRKDPKLSVFSTILRNMEEDNRLVIARLVLVRIDGDYCLSKRPL